MIPKDANEVKQYNLDSPQFYHVASSHPDRHSFCLSNIHFEA